MWRRLAVLIGLVLSLAVFAGCSPSATGTQDVGVDEFLELTQQDSITVIDVRTPQEYIDGHVDGALNIDGESPTFADEIAELDPNQTYAIYCRSGRRAQAAAEVMTKAGFGDLRVLSQGGFAELEAAGAPVSMG